MKLQNSLLFLFAMSCLNISGTDCLAGMITTCLEVNGDVVCTTVGKANLAGHVFFGPAGGDGGFTPSEGDFTTGVYEVTHPDFVPGGVSYYEFPNPIDPPSFGPGSYVLPTSTSGRFMGISSIQSSRLRLVKGALYLPADYGSGEDLPESTAIFANQTFQSLGMTPGIYESFWGTAENQSIQLRIISASSPTAIPEPSSALVWLLFCTLAFPRLRAIQRPT